KATLYQLSYSRSVVQRDQNYSCHRLLSMGKNQKMKSFLFKRIKKWILLAIIGSFAYLLGYSVGQYCIKTTVPVTASP
ncbi:MAG: hypothetical protein ACXWRZ_16400, partial [Bdellovibrio sp.]